MDLGWVEKEAALHSTMTECEMKIAKLQAHVDNKISLESGSEFDTTMMNDWKNDIVAAKTKLKKAKEDMEALGKQAAELLAKMLGTLSSQTRAATQEILTTPVEYEETKWTVKKIAHAKIDNNTIMFPVVEYTGDIPFGKEESKDFKMHSVAAERKIKKHDIPLFDLKQAKLVTTKLLVNLHGYGLAEIQKAYM